MLPVHMNLSAAKKKKTEITASLRFKTLKTN